MTRPARSAPMQPGHAERGIAAQFERIAEVVVEAPQDGVHAAQSAERLEEHGVAAHREVVALDQRHAELAREIGVLEIGLVVGAGREDDGERRFVAGSVQQALRASAPKNPRTRRTAMSGMASGCTCSRISRFSSA